VGQSRCHCYFVIVTVNSVGSLLAPGSSSMSLAGFLRLEFKLLEAYCRSSSSSSKSRRRLRLKNPTSPLEVKMGKLRVLWPIPESQE
jgi:hypothetical protein